MNRFENAVKKVMRNFDKSFPIVRNDKEEYTKITGQVNGKDVSVKVYAKNFKRGSKNVK